MTTFSDRIPDELVTHTTVMCGERGKLWLADLPVTMRQLEHRWSIKVGDPFPAIEFNYVAAAKTLDGEPVVVKIAPPFENKEILSEAAWLQALNGQGAIKLLRANRELRAILIERAIPGRNLAEIFADDPVSALAPAVGVLQEIVRPVPDRAPDVILLDDWFDGFRRSATSEFPAEYSSKALYLYDTILNRSSVPKFYLHGDFHPGNIVSATRSPYLAIDPKGVIGPIGYDIAVFLNNFNWWQETLPDVRSRLAIAVERFSEAFSIDPVVLRQWAYVQMVIGAWWTFDEMPMLYNNEVAKADVWDV